MDYVIIGVGVIAGMFCLGWVGGKIAKRIVKR